MYDRNKRDVSAPAKIKLSAHVKRAHRQANEWFTNASRWTLSLLLLYAFAPHLTPTSVLQNANDTATTLRHFHYTAPRIPWLHRNTDGD